MAYNSVRAQLCTSSATLHNAVLPSPLHHVAIGSSPRACVHPVQAAVSASFTAPLNSAYGVPSLLTSMPSVHNEPFLSRYALGEPLGQGANGIVVSATNRITGEEIAVKVLTKQRNAGRNQRSALHREAGLWRKACSASRQAGRFISIEEDASNYYMVSEKCHGGSLQQMLDERGALTEAELSQVAWCTLTFLNDLHRQSIYYGDLKPGNIILKDVYPCNSDSDCLNVRIVDFGCSQLVSGGAPLRGLCGSPLFLSPEIIKGAYSLPADMWAVGVTLYMLICNQLPFWLEPIYQLEELLSPEDINAAIQYSPVLFAGKHWRGVSENLKDLICRLLEKDPARRLTAQGAMQHPWFESARDMCNV